MTFPFVVKGTVIHGSGRGKKLGFPTANLAVPLPTNAAHGIYAAWVTGNTKKRYPAAVYWGTRPTFGDGEPVLEVYLLNESVDWYGLNITIQLESFIRADKTFASPTALALQMKHDADAVAKALRV